MTASLHSDRDTTPRGWLLRLCAGLLLWASCFVALYAGLSLGCEARWHESALAGISALTAALAVVWAVHLGLIAELLRRQWRWRREPGLLARVVPVLLVVAFIGTLWIGWPVFLLPPCVGPGA